MLDTIFSPSFGNRPAQLVGRADVLDNLTGGLIQMPGSRERASLVLGQRGSGKTVLLWELAEQARELGYAVATPTVATSGMLERVIEKLQDAGEKALGRERPQLVGGSLGALGFSLGLQFDRETQLTKSGAYRLSSLCRRLSEEKIGTLILVDELQANSEDVRNLVVAYQEMVGEGLNVALVMAGLPSAVSATLNDHVLTFLNRARKIELGPLSTVDIDAYFAQSFATLGVRMPDELRRRATQATHGSPYMMQLLGHSLVSYAHNDREVDEATFSRALVSAQEDFENDVCKTSLAALSDRDVEFLEAMSLDDGCSSVGVVAERMGVTPDYAQKYRKRLLDAGIIEAPGRGKIAFAVPYLADYLRSHAR